MKCSLVGKAVWISLILFWTVRTCVAQVPAPVQREAYAIQRSLSAAPLSSIELRWDLSEPVGFMALGDGDSACVTFPSVPGGRLDSLRVGLRRQGSIEGGLWQRSHRGAPLGMPIVVPFTAAGSQEPATPYPVPWPNWATVDLGSYNISTDSAFAVAFVCSGDPLTGQRLMVTEYPDTPSHSLTYLHASGSGTKAGWYVLPVENSVDTSYTYLVRAYVSTLTSVEGGNGVVQEFGLEQNWPNPWNPSTTIGYTVGGIGDQGSGTRNVKLTIYNMLGQEVAVLVNEQQAPGRYQVRFDGSRLASGVYLYRLQAGSFVQTKRMLLLK